MKSPGISENADTTSVGNGRLCTRPPSLTLQSQCCRIKCFAIHPGKSKSDESGASGGKFVADVVGAQVPYPRPTSDFSHICAGQFQVP